MRSTQSHLAELAESPQRAILARVFAYVQSTAINRDHSRMVKNLRRLYPRQDISERPETFSRILFVFVRDPRIGARTREPGKFFDFGAWKTMVFIRGLGRRSFALFFIIYLFTCVRDFDSWKEDVWRLGGVSPATGRCCVFYLLVGCFCCEWRFWEYYFIWFRSNVYKKSLCI